MHNWLQHTNIDIIIVLKPYIIHMWLDNMGYTVLKAYVVEKGVSTIYIHYSLM